MIESISSMKIVAGEWCRACKKGEGFERKGGVVPRREGEEGAGGRFRGGKGLALRRQRRSLMKVVEGEG
jgi:hypothetical protein